MAYQHPAETTLSKLGSGLSEKTKEGVLSYIRMVFYNDDTTLGFRHMRSLIEFSFTHITFDADFKVLIVHPVVWTPLLPRVPYINIQTPADMSSEWDRGHYYMVNRLGLSHCAIRFYASSDPSQAKTFPPSWIWYDDDAGEVANKDFQLRLIGDRISDLGKLMVESQRAYVKAQGLTWEDVLSHIKALESAQAAYSTATGQP